jgi:type I restriction enzyme M protein
LKELKSANENDQEVKDEIAVLKRWLALSENEAHLKKTVKEQETALDRLAFEKYPVLTSTEIKEMVINHKWMTHLSAIVRGELDRVSQSLTGRVRSLAERYAKPLPDLIFEVAVLAGRVDEHLKKMAALAK